MLNRKEILVTLTLSWAQGLVLLSYRHHQSYDYTYPQTRINKMKIPIQLN